MNVTKSNVEESKRRSTIVGETERMRPLILIGQS